MRVSNAALLKTSRAVVGFWLMHLLDRRDMLSGPLADLFARAARGELEPQIGATYPLERRAPRARGPAGAPHHGKLLLRPIRGAPRAIGSLSGRDDDI